MSKSLISQLIELENKHNKAMQIETEKFNAASKILGDKFNAASKILKDKITKQAHQESQKRYFLVSRLIAKNMIILYEFGHDFETSPHVLDSRSKHTANITLGTFVNIIVHYNPFEYCLVEFSNGNGIGSAFEGRFRTAIEVTEDEDIITGNITPKALKKYPILISKSSRNRFVSIDSFFSERRIRNVINEYTRANTKRR